MEQVTDMYGKRIEVTDLAKAIRQAEAFSGYEIEGDEWKEFARELKTYWKDLLQKLRLLQPGAGDASTGK